jgi:hypothetical protein
MAKSKSMRDRAKSLADSAEKSIKETSDATRDAARKGSVKMALRAVEMQRNAFKTTMKGLERLEKITAKGMHDLVKRSSWIPNEGKDVVDEWIDTAKKGRADFHKSMDTSFDLMKHFFERVDKGKAGKKTSAKKSTKKSTAKKSGAKKKSAPKKKSAAKKKSTASTTSGNTA